LVLQKCMQQMYKLINFHCRVGTVLAPVEVVCL